MALRAVIFDLGNVLAFHDNALLFRKLGERAGLAEGEVGRRLLGDPLWDEANRGRLDGDGIRREVSRALGFPFAKDEFEVLWSCHFTLNAPVFPLIERLVGMVKLLLLSNTNVLHRDFVVPRLPILQRFDHLLCSCDLGLIKPEPALFQAALARAGCAPDEAAFFDDLPAYVQAAQALGLHGRVFTTADAFPEQLRSLGL